MFILFVIYFLLHQQEGYLGINSQEVILPGFVSSAESNELHDPDDDYTIELDPNAIESYKKSCNLKYDGIACINVAVMYGNGTGTKKSRDKASEYFGKACEYGYIGGCKNWNILNGYGPEVPNVSQ